MKIITDKPYEKEKDELLLDYYFHNRENNGNTLFSKVTDKIIANELDSEIMFNYDVNYSIAYNTVENIYNDPNTVYFGLYSDDNTLLVHTKCEIEKVDAGTWGAYVSDLIVKNKESLMLLKDGQEQINKMYLFIVASIEKYINDHHPEVDFIKYCITDDAILSKILAVKSYTEDNLFEQTFEKKTRKRELFNEWGNSSKQRNK